MTAPGQVLACKTRVATAHLKDTVSFAVIRVSVMRAACQVGSITILQGGPAGANRAANRVSRADNQLRRPGESDPSQLFIAQPAMNHLVHVFGFVHQKELIIAGRIGRQQLNSGQARGDNLMM
jgi:hypothetical protein